MDRSNLGRQTYDEFANFQPPDDARKFPELYTVQRLTANAVNPAAKVVVTTVQRLYSMLRGEVEYDAGNEEGSAFDSAGPWAGEPPRVEYNAALPPEFFDFVVVDECHRSIYDLWSQVLLYFDAFLIGTRTTPSRPNSASGWTAWPPTSPPASPSNPRTSRPAGSASRGAWGERTHCSATRSGR